MVHIIQAREGCFLQPVAIPGGQYGHFMQKPVLADAGSAGKEVGALYRAIARNGKGRGNVKDIC